MSYCRWSSNDFKCDLYCYEYVYGGWITHIAGLRPKYKTKLPKKIKFSNPPTENQWKRWWKRHQKVLKMHSKAKLIPIGLPFDGKTFHSNTLEEFLGLLIELRNIGYKFPDYVLVRINEEIERENRKIYGKKQKTKKDRFK
ncbi:MAG: hypothetical protein ACTSPD_10235 [Promethearchaeota archaeon]